MIADLIFDWAQRTPEKTAVIYNERSWSYRSFAEHIAIARGYFLKRGYAGSGYAVLATHNRMDFWILSLALRSLGLTTVAVGSAAMLGELQLPDIRCVVTREGEVWPDLARLCKARGLVLLSVSLEDEPSLERFPPKWMPVRREKTRQTKNQERASDSNEADRAPDAALTQTPHEPGGHILLTSGTTGRFKMVLSTPATDTVFLRWRTEFTGIGQDSVLSVFSFEP